MLSRKIELLNLNFYLTYILNLHLNSTTGVNFKVISK